MTRRVAIALTLLTVAVVLAGCGASSERRAAVSSAVNEYNRALITAFETQDMNALNRVATEDQATREYYLMAALAEGKTRMLASAVNVTIESVTFTGESTAEVLTSETWDYRHVSTETSATVREERGVTYRLRYQLVLEDGRWLVSDVRSLDNSGTTETTAPSKVTTP